MEAAFCIETLEDALARYGKPEIFAVHWPNLHRALAGNGIAISMDGKDAWRDNVFVGSGAASNTRRCICAPTTASAKLVLRSAGILTSTMAAGPTRALTATHPIKPTSTRAHAWLRQDSIQRCGKSVQRTGTTTVRVANERSRACRQLSWGLLFHPGGTGAQVLRAAPEAAFQELRIALSTYPAVGATRNSASCDFNHGVRCKTGRGFRGAEHRSARAGYAPHATA